MSIDIDGLTLDELVALNHRTSKRIKYLERAQAHTDMMALDLGGRVHFDSPDGRQLGTLIRFNRKTVLVMGDDGRQWRLSPQLLAPVKNVGETAATPQKSDKKKRSR